MPWCRTRGTMLKIYGRPGDYNSIGVLTRELALALNRNRYAVGIVNEYPERWQHPSFRAKTRHLIVDETADGIPFGLSDTTPASVPRDHVRLVLIDDYTATPENVGKWHADCRQLLVPAQHARSVLEGLGADDVKVVPFGVDLASFRPVPKDLRRRNAKWIVPGCLDDQTFVMLHYGALQDRKGTAELVDAYRRAFGKRDNVCLVIYGATCDWGDPVDNYAKAGEGAPILAIDGNLTVEELNELHSMASVGVFPNFIEGFGLCGLQCLASGIPVVLPKHTGNLEYGSEECCWWLTQYRTEQSKYKHLEWYPPDVDELAATLAYLYAHPKEVAKKAKAARPRALEFTWDKSALAVAEALSLPRKPAKRDGRVQVVVISPGNLPQMERCFDAIGKTRNVHHEVAFVHTSVDNAAEVKAVCSGNARFMVGNPERGVINRNLGWKESDTEYVACVDDDYVVPPDWLEKATEYLKTHKQVGLVGLKSFRFDGKIDHAGGFYYGEDEADRGHYRNGEDDAPEVCVSRPVMYCPSMCWVGRRVAFEEVGFLWRDYAPVWHEDVDLCMALWAAGWEVHVLCSTSGKHEGGVTTSRDPGGFQAKHEVFLGWWGWMLPQLRRQVDG